MTRYRVKRAPIHRRDETLAPGDICEPTDAELRAFGDNLEAVSAPDAGAAPEPEAESDEAICGAALSAGGTCERPAASCPYHDTEAGG